MQKLLIVLLVTLTSMSLYAQPSKKPVAKKPAASSTANNSPVVLKNQVDSFSYAIGVSIANFYKEQGINNINSAMVTRAVNDCRSGKAKMDDGMVNNVIMNYMQEVRSQKSAGTRKAGEAFLANNKSQPGVITTPSGLQYIVMKEGTGPKPISTDKVKVHYHGTLIDGTPFDSSVQRGEPIEFAVTGVITGWIEVLQLMPVGSKWKVFVPSNLAYGDNDNGPIIKAGSVLIFELELLDIVK